MFSTIFVGQFDLRTRDLNYSNAGHSPVIYCPPGERARMLGAVHLRWGCSGHNCLIAKSVCAGRYLLLATMASMRLRINPVGFSVYSNHVAGRKKYAQLSDEEINEEF
jgi:hypothetical protein